MRLCGEHTVIWSGKDTLLSASTGDFFTGLVTEYGDEEKEGNKDEANAEIKCRH